MKTKLLALAATALLLAGCSSISEGFITNKDHREGYYTTTYTSQCVAYNKDGTCSSSISVPQTTYTPPSWRFDISKGKDDGWVYVGSGTYDEYAVGDYYPRRDNVSDE